jgi:hypothetical protein
VRLEGLGQLNNPMTSMGIGQEITRIKVIDISITFYLILLTLLMHC